MQDRYFNLNINSTNVRNKNLRQRATGWVLGLFWALAPGWTRKLTLRLFFSPRRYRTTTGEEEVLAKGRPFRVQVHDNILQGWCWGEGPGVLLFHGWNGRGIQFQQFIEPLVNAGYTAIAIDGPAHGASTGRVTSYFEFTDVLRTLLTRNHRFRIEGVIAHSFGAAALINALTKEQVAVNAICIAPVLKLQELLRHAFEQYGIPQRIYHSLIGEFEDRFGYRLTEDNPHRLIGDLPGSLVMVHDVDDRTAPYPDVYKAARDNDHIDLWTSKGLGHSGVLRDPEVVDRCVAYLRHKTERSNPERLTQEAS